MLDLITLESEFITGLPDPKVALIVLLLYQRELWPLANSRFHQRPNPKFQSYRLEASVKGDPSNRNVIQ